MKKILGIFVGIVAVFLAIKPASAAITIDGVVSPGEWDGATVIPAASGIGNVSIIADTNYLYALINVTDSTDARLGQNIVGNDQTGLNINPTDGGSWGFPYDIIFQTGADPNAWGGTSSGTSDNWYTQWSIKVSGITTQQVSLPPDLETETIYSGGNRVSEWKLPLSSIGVSPGDELKVGGAIDRGDGNSYVYPVGLDWGIRSTFQSILIPIQRSAEITSPLLDQNVSGDVNFNAYLIDDDPDPIQWAVRRGTCAAATNTVFGNVDGHSDVATINTSVLSNQTFSFTGDMSGMTPGMYCFIYNPTEDSGEANIRETREFILKDTVAPLVTIESPNEGDEVSGTVEIYGTVVEDYLLSHYNISVYPGGADFNDFSERIAQATVYRSDGFNNEPIFSWDSTAVTDGEYLFRLAARDAAGNRSYDGDPYIGGDDSQHVIRVTVNNVPDLIGPPVDKNACKEGGWRVFNNPTFKNQGDCVSYVQSNENAVGNKSR